MSRQVQMLFSDTLAAATRPNADTAHAALITDINLQFLLLLREQAASDAPIAALPQALAELRPVWASLNNECATRLAACPYVLIDPCFDDIPHWSRGNTPQVQDESPQWATQLFSGARGLSLTRLLVTCGWHMAHSNPQLAALTLGMPAAVGQVLRSTPLHRLDGLAEQARRWFGMRWPRHTAIWRGLLSAATTADDMLLRQVQLQGLQRLAGEALRA